MSIDSFSALLPNYPSHYASEIIFALSYLQHGGSGLGWSPSEIEALDLNRALWFVDRLAEERQREAKAIKEASRRRRS